MADITMAQKKILEPFGNLYAQMDGMVRAMSDEDLKAALAACRATSTTNCWCYSFYAAQYIPLEIEAEMYQRKQRAKTA